MRKFMCLLFLLVSFYSNAGLAKWASVLYLSGNFKMPEEQECLAKNIWYESRGESKLGKTLVANVVLNRTQFGKPFANTICTVVYQKSQFSWTLNKEKKTENFNNIIKNNVTKDYKNLQETIEITFLHTYFSQNLITNATHFTSEKPKFKRVRVLGRVGGHTFFRYLGNE